MFIHTSSATVRENHTTFRSNNEVWTCIANISSLQVHLGLHGAFWLYSAVSVVGLVFAVVFVPETKGRTLDEMEPKVSEGDGGGGILDNIDRKEEHKV